VISDWRLETGDWRLEIREQAQMTKSKGQIKAKAQMTKLFGNWNFGSSHEIATSPSAPRNDKGKRTRNDKQAGPLS